MGETEKTLKKKYHDERVYFYSASDPDGKETISRDYDYGHCKEGRRIQDVLLSAI